MSLRARLILETANRIDKLRERRRRNALRRNACSAFEMTDAEFIKTYRLSKPLVEALINDLAPFIKKEQRNDGLTLSTKVLISLAFFASGSYQHIIGQSIYHYVSQPTVSRAVKEVTRALNTPSVFKKYVHFPMTSQERNKIKTQFYDKFKLPGVIGCIDGTHVGIIRPCLYEERYFNRKGYHSLNVMIICDADLNIMCIDPSSPGSSHDSVVWRDHPLNNYLKEKYNTGEIMYLLGDSGYPLRRTMMTPYLNAIDGSPQAYLFQLHVTARNTIERCIGVLKARFRCLLVARKLHYDPESAGLIVNACAVLHNIATRAQLPTPCLNEAEALQEEMAQMYGSHQLQIENEAPIRHRRENIELQQGRHAQQSLMQRVWSEAH